MKNHYKLLGVSVAIFLANIIFLLLYFGGYVPDLAPLFMIVISALFLIITGTRTVTIYYIQSDTGKSVLFLTLGSLVGFFGEFHNTLTLYAKESVKSPGFADLFYYPALVLLAIGFYFAMRANKVEWTRKKKVVFAAWSIIIVSILVVINYLGTEKDLAVIGVSIGYLIFSSAISLIGLRVFMATWEYRGGAIFKAWFGIFLGICSLIVTVFVLFLTIEETAIDYRLTFIPITLLAVSQIFLAYGITVLGSIAKGIQRRVITQTI